MTMTNGEVWLLLLLNFGLVSMGRADCLLPQLSGNVLLSEKSILQNNFPDQSEAFLECARGHETESGSTSIFCRDGTWSAVELKCKKIDCGQPKPSPHMTYTISEGTLFGAYVKPRCETGYYLEGSSYRQCLVSGWSGRPKCSLITCERPNDIELGRIVTSLAKEYIVMDDVIEYSCDAGYVLNGNRYITCNEDGEYSSPPPTCKAIQCPILEGMPGIRIEGTPPYAYKSEARFNCEPGYVMKGSAIAVCEERGWSALPECVQEKSNSSDINQKKTTAASPTNKPTTSTIFHDRVKTTLICICISVIILMIVGVLYFVHRQHKQRG